MVSTTVLVIRTRDETTPETCVPLTVEFQINGFAMKKSAAIGIRVHPRVKRAAENAAIQDFRSLASLLEKLLVEHLTESGYLNGNASVRSGDDKAELELVSNGSHPAD